MNSLNLRRRFAALLLCLATLSFCPGCSTTAGAEDEDLHVVATTYPIYALAAAISAGADHVELSRLNTGQVSCLHDYTLTVSDARRLESADLLLLNGAGLEEFLTGTLERLDTPTVDCSAVLSLLESDEQDHQHESGEEGGHEYDPHIWMDPRNAAQMALAISDGLSLADPGQAAIYQDNAEQVSSLLLSAYRGWTNELSGLSCPYLITFHDGFRYFADAFDFTLLFAMEEEDGATASAKDIRTASSLVKEYGLPAVFMEENGSGSAASAVAGETGAAVETLSMLMDGPVSGGGTAGDVLTTLYLDPMGQNIDTLAEVLR